MREVLARVTLSTPSALSYQYRELEAKGHLRRKQGQPRTVEVRLPGEPDFPAAGTLRGDSRPEKVAWVPVLGRIAAGAPVLAEQQPAEEYLPLPRDVVGGADEDLFIMEVTSDSMSGVGILTSDWVVIRRLFLPPSNGDIVAAEVDGAGPEIALKTYMKLGRDIVLMSQNPDWPPLLGNRATIRGKVVAVLRRVPSGRQ
jgi:repressor LexA